MHHITQFCYFAPPIQRIERVAKDSIIKTFKVLTIKKKIGRKKRIREREREKEKRRSQNIMFLYKNQGEVPERLSNLQ